MTAANIKILLVILLGFVVLWWITSPTSCPTTKEGMPKNLPLIYAITPTYYRPLQKAELTRLSQTLMLVPNVFWVIVEDADEISELVRDIRKHARMIKRSVQLQTETPKDQKPKKKDPHWLKPRGVEQRNTGLQYVRRRIAEEKSHSIIYFMDDDNTYSLSLFKEMAKIEPGRVGVWPVGLVGGLKVERALVNINGIVTGFNAAWAPERPFPMDMAGFAISSELLKAFPNARFNNQVRGGYQETELLRQITTRQALQPLAYRCMEVHVWHTRTQPVNLKEEEKLVKKKLPPSDAEMEV